MSFSVDQFMQVRCKLVLTSDLDSETVQPENETIRLCTYAHDKNSILIIMICSNHASNNNIITYYLEKRTNRMPRPRTKQIFYHHYNEDIVALGLSQTGNRLAMVSSSSTIYILPIKNILLRSSQCKSMYFYDALIINCCTIDDPISVVYWEGQNRSTIIVAGSKGKISFISVDNKREINITNINEDILKIELIKDMCSYSLLITCDNFKQYRYTLETTDENLEQTSSKIIQKDEYINLEKEISPSWDRKPIPIRLQSANISSGSSSTSSTSGVTAAAALHRVLVPAGRATGHSSLFTGRERSTTLIFYHSVPGMISVVDILGGHSQKSHQPQANNNHQKNITYNNEPRLLRFFSSKQFYYRPQKPSLVSKISSLDPDERITHLVLTDRFIAVATDKDRCLVNSRNCCNPKTQNSLIELNPLVKEVVFNNDENILQLIKSPVTKDQDNIIDSFLLITTKSIYSIEARQSCREMYINLIDSHLGIKPPRSKSNLINENSSSQFPNQNNYIMVDNYRAQRKFSESNLMVSNFLGHRDEVYEKINYDSKAFSILFKLELNSLYEAYGDKLMLRGQHDLANRFFQMAKFDYTKTLGKYIKLRALKETIDYVTDLLSDENVILDEKERIDLSRAAFDCLLAKTIAERSKMILFENKIGKSKIKSLCDFNDQKFANCETNAPKLNETNSSGRPSYCSCPITPNDIFKLCEHSPKGSTAKLSGNTIIPDSYDDEATMTNNDGQKQPVIRRLECEKSLISFVKRLLPSSLYTYAITQLVDFGLLDLADYIARSDSLLDTLTAILLKSRVAKRLIFRDAKLDFLMEKLESTGNEQLTKIDKSREKFLEIITSPEVTEQIVKDINLSSEYLGYEKTTVKFRKYSYTALKHLELIRELVAHKDNTNHGKNHSTNETSSKESTNYTFPLDQKKKIENTFLQFLKASLNESTEDSCKLWFNYINFYLNYVGEIGDLEADILNLIETDLKDCRTAITLYKAIGRDEEGSNKPFAAEEVTGTPLESMQKLYNLSELFRNEFLMKLLEATLELVPQSWYQVHSFSHMLVQ